MVKQTNTIEEWRFLAERDLTVAEYLAANMVPTPTQIIAFHCQQAAEKYLKGALVFLAAGLGVSEADMRLVLRHTNTIKDFLATEIPELFQ
jgi:HEPN domain-containing protein